MEPAGSKPPEGISSEEWTELVQLWVEAPEFSRIGSKNMRALLTGLTRECPFGGNPEDCCLHRVRQMHLKERIDWVFRLSDVEMEAIYNRHLQCSRCKTNKLRDE